MHDVSHRMEQNHLLRLLPEDVRQRLFPKLELTALPFGHVLYEAAVAQRCVFFPTDCVISLLYVMEDGASAEIAIVGNEGVVNVALFMGGETTSNRAIVQNGGHALRLEGQILRDEFRRSGALRHRFLRYTQALLTQMAQTAVCNRYHTADQQLSRWLLMSLDRLPTNRLTMTQELIANMLGVRREGVTEAAGKLEAQGIIHYKRGQIIVLDRPKLEEASCECYRAVRREAARLLSDHVP